MYHDKTLKGVVKLRGQRHIGQSYICPDFNFTVGYYILMLLGTNGTLERIDCKITERINFDETDCRAEESHKFKLRGQSLKNGQNYSSIITFI